MNLDKRYDCNHIEEVMWTRGIARRGYSTKEAHRDIGDQEFEEARACDIGDLKTPKPDCVFLW